MWFLSEKAPCDVKMDACSVSVGGNVVQLSIKSTCSLETFNSEVSYQFYFGLPCRGDSGYCYQPLLSCRDLSDLSAY